jgi:ribosomal protein S18 acetylase RimI-like enzyme
VPQRPASRVRNVLIRRATPEDAAAIAAVLHESFIQFKPQYSDGGFAATTPDANGVLARMKEGPIWVAMRENAMLGTAAAVLQGESLYIRGMAVLPAARGAGVGESLMAEIERYAGSAGCRRLFLSTTPFLIAAIHLYEKLGFLRTSTGARDLFGTPLFTMEKTIVPQP